jgi:hypothetical protein
MLIYSIPLKGCFEHSNLLKVNELEPHFITYCALLNFIISFTQLLHSKAINNKVISCDTTPFNKEQSRVTSRKEETNQYKTREGRPIYYLLSSNYELFNCNNFNIRYQSWNYRGCWHQTCPLMVTQ